MPADLGGTLGTGEGVGVLRGAEDWKAAAAPTASKAFLLTSVGVGSGNGIGEGDGSGVGVPSYRGAGVGSF